MIIVAGCVSSLDDIAALAPDMSLAESNPSGLDDVDDAKVDDASPRATTGTKSISDVKKAGGVSALQLSQPKPGAMPAGDKKLSKAELKKGAGKDKSASSAAGASAPAVPGRSLRSSEEILNRIRWDPRYDQNEFIIVYEDRFQGMQEVRVPNFRQNDDEFIPWHRIWQVKRNGHVVWDRQTKTDLLQ